MKTHSSPRAPQGTRPYALGGAARWSAILLATALLVRGGDTTIRAADSDPAPPADKAAPAEPAPKAEPTSKLDSAPKAEKTDGAVKATEPTKPAATLKTGETAKTDGTSKTDSAAPSADAVTTVPDPKPNGGEPDGIVQVANLVYAGTKSSQCFSDHFLIAAEQQSAISTSRRFHAVKLSSEEIYNFPLVIMTGEGAFQLTDRERENLKEYIDRGGFLLASAGCSSKDWERSFRKEMALVFADAPLAALGMDHPVFHTVFEINDLQGHHGQPRPLEGISLRGRLGVLYSQDGLNDTEHTQGCCCCGGNEITNCAQINVNVLAYALTY